VQEKILPRKRLLKICETAREITEVIRAGSPSEALLFYLDLLGQRLIQVKPLWEEDAPNRHDELAIIRGATKDLAACHDRLLQCPEWPISPNLVEKLHRTASRLQELLEAHPGNLLMEEVVYFDASSALASKADVSGRLKIDLDQCLVIFGNLQYPVPDLITLRLLQALLNAHQAGETPITASELAQKANFPNWKDSRPSRYFEKHLPIRIRSIIEQKSGKGGGFSLRFPPPDHG
jgi:hypothetical protein